DRTRYSREIATIDELLIALGHARNDRKAVAPQRPESCDRLCGALWALPSATLAAAMQKQAWTWTTPRLSEPARLVRWGHFGAPVLIFPTAGGDFEELERFHLISALG